MTIFDRLGARLLEPHTKERAYSQSPAFSGVAGARIGRGSSFGYGQPQFEDGGPVDEDGNPIPDPDGPSTSVEVQFPQGDPPEYKRIISGGVKILSRTARVSLGGDPDASAFVEIDRMHRLAFFYTEFPPKRTNAGFQPAFTTSFDLYFALHPTGDESVIG